jgi:hypothetical protein
MGREVGLLERRLFDRVPVGREPPSKDADPGIPTLLSIEETEPHGSAPGIRRKIEGVASIAAAHGSSISSAETLLLLPSGTFECIEELESFVETDPTLSGQLLVHGGQIVLRNAGNFGVRASQLNLSDRRGQLAQSFTDRFAARCPWIRFVGISGSTAYAAAKPSDDIDFFIVTQRNRLWITLLVGMTAARIHRVKHPAWPVLCLNRILEEDVCRDEFRKAQDALFAREALSLRVLEGVTFYRELVESAPWMKRIFPELYRKVTTLDEGRSQAARRDGGLLWSFANVAAFTVLATYLPIVGLWRNRRLVRQGNLTARYRTIIERGFFAYESRKYENLRQTYREVFD